ncbi:MAG: hypothetical protein U0M60_09635 [Clostridia bacterium]|nr:hypothetical protein [Clostridia bacterium]
MGFVNLKSLEFKNRIIVVIMSVLVLVCGAFAADINQFLSGAILILGGIAVYFFIVNKLSDKNYLDFMAVFSGVWIATIGLAQLRLLDYQKIWEPRTWLNIVLATVCFQIGIPLGHYVGHKIAAFIDSKKGLKIGRIGFEFKKQRLFWICLGATVFAVAMFVWNVMIKGYIPFFSTMFNAYIEFYTKRMVFVTAACVISPIAYWCIKKCELDLWKKICMYVCIAANTFIIPILQVNRGVFIVAALMLTAAVFFLNGKKFLVMLVCLIVTFGFYEVGSIARNYSNEYLAGVFEPSVFDPAGDPGDVDDPDVGDPSDYEGNGFSIHPKVAFLYGYFTVSHDNFNEAIIHASEYTYGVRQLAPFNVILRNHKIDQIISDAEYHFVKPNLNTANLISTAFYDLREFGVIVLVLLWTLILGALEKLYLERQGVFALASLGNALTPVVLCFFASWFDNFTMWMFWGTIMIIALLACIKILPISEKIK